MKFAIGYQLPDEDEEPFVNLVADYAQRIDEVYFPWLDMPSGRSPMATREGFVDLEAQAKLERDLGSLREMGVKLDLLLNASCYGRWGTSRRLVNHVCSVVHHLHERFALDAVTTMSPVIAAAVKEHFSGVDVRASVNMRLGTARAMEYVAHLFDSFYVQREYNRDLGRIDELFSWADANRKRLFMLANSGCLLWCAVQTFHDNLVSHERDVAETVNVSADSPALCWSFYRDRANWTRFLQNSWIRPEDLHHYDGLFPVVKLATRMHARPRMVMEAYTSGEYRGNLPDLFEPGYGPVFAPYVIDNTRFPSDWFERTTTRGGVTPPPDDSYYDEVLERVLVRAE